MNETKPFRRAHSAALRFLSYRARSKSEVRTRLRRRFPPPLVEQVLDALTERSLIDDVQFANQWRETRTSVSPRSAWAIKRELVAKGVDRDVATQAVADVDDEEGAYRAGFKHAGPLDKADPTTFKRRLLGYLQRRGFADSISRRTIDRLWNERIGTDLE